MKEIENPNPRTEIKLAVGLLTRLPVHLEGAAPDYLVARSSRWFPLVGALVGLIASIVLLIGLWAGLPPWPAALITIGASIFVTGALHEDGIADLADGFGGGAGRDAKLAIMRDSRVGTYGVLALILTVGLKASLLVALLEMGTGVAAAAIIVAAAVSRLTPVILMNRLVPARDDGMAVNAGRPEADSIRIACACSLASLLLLAGWDAMLVTLISTMGGCGITGLLAQRQIGGQTGDVLGAGQQVTEICILAGLVAVGP